jgi:DNA-binding Lrp family transcriptional regulator
VRSHLATRATLEASRWREGALDPEQRRRLHARAKNRPEQEDTRLTAADHRIIRALNVDGRMSFERLAEHAGMGPVAVRRRLTRLEQAGLVTFRCDTSRRLSVQDRSVVLRTIKLLGRILDAEGRSLRSVPLLADAIG